jgi:hypothetical protein
VELADVVLDCPVGDEFLKAGSQMRCCTGVEPVAVIAGPVGASTGNLRHKLTAARDKWRPSPHRTAEINALRGGWFGSVYVEAHDILLLSRKLKSIPLTKTRLHRALAGAKPPSGRSFHEQIGVVGAEASGALPILVTVPVLALERDSVKFIAVRVDISPDRGFHRKQPNLSHGLVSGYSFVIVIAQLDIGSVHGLPFLCWLLGAAAAAPLPCGEHGGSKGIAENEKDRLRFGQGPKTQRSVRCFLLVPRHGQRPLGRKRSLAMIRDLRLITRTRAGLLDHNLRRAVGKTAMSDSELDAMKSSIDLRVFAADAGYELDRKESS